MGFNVQEEVTVMNSRLQSLEKWYHGLNVNYTSIPELVSGDASFRKFYRVPEGILMDAPPATEKNREFIELSSLYLKNGVRVPRVKAFNLEDGFLLVEDLGSVTFANKRTDENRVSLYNQAVDFLLGMTRVDASGLPAYDGEFILRENGICTEWYFNKSRKVNLSEEESLIIARAGELMIANSLEQPQIAMHRDYHSRNIMITGDDGLALVDFQDTVKGPLTYDLASLLLDCYYELPLPELDGYIERAYGMYCSCGIIPGVSLEKFRRWLFITALQRHFKCAGIFNRLHLRDGKPGYLKDIPLVLKYIDRETSMFDDFRDLRDLFRKYPQ